MGTSIDTASANGTITLNGATVLVPGNLTVQGTQTSVESVNTVINDNTIIINQGETGAGVTLNYAGVEIERGSLDNAKMVWDEANERFTFLVGSTDAEVFIGTLTGATLSLEGSVVTVDQILDEDDFASDSDTAIPTQQSTKAYIASEFAAFDDDRIVKENSSIIITDTGSNGTITFTVDSVAEGTLSANSFNLFDFALSDATISTATDTDLTLDPNGTGEVVVEKVTKFAVVADPTAEAGYTKVYAKAPTTSGSGLYIQNNTNGVQELISKKRARLFGLIF